MDDWASRRTGGDIEWRRLIESTTPSRPFRRTRAFNRTERHRSCSCADRGVCYLCCCHQSLSPAHATAAIAAICTTTGAIGNIFSIFIPILCAAPKSMAFTPRRALTLFSAILCLSTTSAFGELPRVLLPPSTQHWMEEESATGRVW